MGKQGEGLSTPMLSTILKELFLPKRILWINMVLNRTLEEPWLQKVVLQKQMVLGRNSAPQEEPL